MNIEEHYRELFKQFGDSHKSAQWSDQETQFKRFKILSEIDDLTGKKVLDFGCGTGELATFLKNNNIMVDYTGVDLVIEMLACGKEKHPQHRFELFETIKNEKFDYIFISGVFNNLIEDNRAFYQTILKELAPLAKQGIALNMLSHYVDYRDEGLFYEKPEEVFAFGKNEITPYVVVRNEYQLKENIIPFEFTVYLYMKE